MNKRKLKKILSSSVDAIDPLTLKILADVGNKDYYVTRAIEELRSRTKDSLGRYTLAIVLLGLALQDD